MVQQIPSVSDGSSGVLASMVNHAETARAQAQAAGTYTGREPFNYVLLALYPTDGAKTALPAMPVGFLAHRQAVAIRLVKPQGGWLRRNSGTSPLVAAQSLFEPFAASAGTGGAKSLP